VIWQCTCDGRIECEPSDTAERKLLARFLRLHARCPGTWAERWRPDAVPGDSALMAQVERHIGFSMDDEGDDRA